MLARLRALVINEPVRIIGIIVAVAVFLAAKLGVALDAQSFGQAIFLVLPVLLGTEAARSQVTPYAGPVDQPSDELLPAAVAKIPPE